MRLTSATVHALRALVYLARHGGERPVPSHVIADAEGLPERSLLKALAPLVTARVLHSLRGPRGGYRLALRPNNVTLLEVVEAVEGPIRGQAPAVGGNAEARRFDARLQATCDKAAEVTRERLRRVSLAELAGA